MRSHSDEHIQGALRAVEISRKVTTNFRLKVTT